LIEDLFTNPVDVPMRRADGIFDAPVCATDARKGINQAASGVLDRGRKMKICH